MAATVVNLFHAGDECDAVTGGWEYSSAWDGSITYGLQGGYNTGAALDVFSWQNDGTIAFAKTSSAQMGLERAAAMVVAFTVVYADAMSEATDCGIHINGTKRASLAGYAVGSHTITIPLNDETVDLVEYRVGGAIRSQIQFASISVELCGPYIPTAGHISVYNGTEHLRIGKLYLFDGSSLCQIGKVYDHNGTTSSLIYSAEEQVYPGTAPTTTYTQEQITVSGFSLSVEAHQCGYGILTIPIDVTNYKSIKIVGTLNSGACGMSFGTGNVNNQLGALDIALGNNRAGYGYGFIWNATAGAGFIDYTTKNVSETIDVSGASGTYYLCVGLYASNVNHAGKDLVQITSVIATT